MTKVPENGHKGWSKTSSRKGTFGRTSPKRGELGYLPFTWENRKFQLENQMVRAIPFGKLQKIWAAI